MSVNLFCVLATDCLQEIHHLGQLLSFLRLLSSERCRGRSKDIFGVIAYLTPSTRLVIIEPHGFHRLLTSIHGESELFGLLGGFVFIKVTERKGALRVIRILIQTEHVVQLVVLSLATEDLSLS